MLYKCSVLARTYTRISSLLLFTATTTGDVFFVIKIMLLGTNIGDNTCDVMGGYHIDITEDPCSQKYITVSVLNIPPLVVNGCVYAGLLESRGVCDSFLL